MIERGRARKAAAWAIVRDGVHVVAVAAPAAERALWLRYPAISPDGTTVAFSYRGDLWKVPATGGTASR